MLGLELTVPGFDYGCWFRELADQLGIAVVATDAAAEYAGSIEDAGLERQQCMVHIQRALPVERTPETGLAGRLGGTAGAPVPTAPGVAP